MSTLTSNAATKPIEQAVYAKERLQQEGSAASAQAQGATQPYVQQAKDTLNNAASTAATYATAAKDSVVNATSTNATSTSTSETGPTYVEQAKSLAASTATAAQNAAAGAAATTGTYVNAAQEKLSSAANQTGAAANNFQNDAAAHTDAAAREGQHDVESAKATTGGQVHPVGICEQDVVLTRLQSYVNAGKQQLDNYAASHPPNTETTLGSITAQLHSVTSAALGTTGQYLASAHSTLQPQGEAVKRDLEAVAGTVQEKANVVTGYGIAAKEQAQPHVDAAAASAHEHLSNAQSVVQPQVGATKNGLGASQGNPLTIA
ncbi:hypothetical protein AURDEDRAFT_158831 [Auricularia subglabra TFB-10046 SS5]|nr:hypothetical protein AURDEDRAFT_158831 [Auricularia subglabra TFB-10046 SS5]